MVLEEVIVTIEYKKNDGLDDKVDEETGETHCLCINFAFASSLCLVLFFHIRFIESRLSSS